MFRVGEAALDILEDVRALIHWDRSYVMNGAVQDPNDIEAQLVHVGFLLSVSSLLLTTSESRLGVDPPPPMDMILPRHQHPSSTSSCWWNVPWPLFLEEMLMRAWTWLHH